MNIKLFKLNDSIARAGAARSGGGRLREQTDATEGYRTAEGRLRGGLLWDSIIENLYKYLRSEILVNIVQKP